MIRVWLTDLFKALLRVQPQVTGPYRAYQTTRSTGGFDLLWRLAVWHGAAVTAKTAANAGVCAVGEAVHGDGLAAVADGVGVALADVCAADDDTIVGFGGVVAGEAVAFAVCEGDGAAASVVAAVG